MSDISMCDGKDCSLKESCHRYTAPANPYMQSYISPEVRGADCKAFWSNKGYKETNKE